VTTTTCHPTPHHVGNGVINNGGVEMTKQWPTRVAYNDMINGIRRKLVTAGVY